MARIIFSKQLFYLLRKTLDATTEQDHIVLLKADSLLNKLFAVDDPKFFHNSKCNVKKKSSSSYDNIDADCYWTIIFFNTYSFTLDFNCVPVPLMDAASNQNNIFGV